MKRFASPLLASILTVIVWSTALAGNIAGGRIAGHIPTGRAAGNIPVGKSSTAGTNPTVLAAPASRFDVEISGSLVGLIRMLLDSGALL